MEGELRKKTESKSGKGTEMESVQETEMDGGLGKETEIESSKGTEYERGLRKKLEMLTKARHEVTRLMNKWKDPARQKALLLHQQNLLSEERRILHMMVLMGKSLKDIVRYPDSYSGDEMGRDSGEHQSLINMEPQLGISKGAVRDSSKEDAGGMEMGHGDSVVALSRHLEMLRREISFLRREVTSRSRAAGKKKACQDQISNLTLQLEEMRTQQVKEVNLPYLGCKTEEAMDFLLLETQQLLFRFNSLAPTLKTFRIPISSDKVEKLRLISNALVGISELIKSHKSAAHKQYDEDGLDRNGWEATWGSRTGRNGGFDDITTLSPMRFTPSTPGILRFPSVAGPSLQLYSIKLVDLNPNLCWPLDVYGVVSARDDLDHNRNILFCRSADNCQRIKQEDPFLHLTGPSRAIVADEPVFFQIELKLKYGAQFKDTALFTAYRRYRSLSVRQYDTMEISTPCCTAEIRVERLDPSIQATIVGVRVVKGEPFNYGCKVSCLFSPVDAMEGCAAEVVLLDCNGKRMHVGSDGYLPLSRNVVSVGLQGTLRVVIGGYSNSEPSISRINHVDFPIQQCQTSMLECYVGGSEVEIVVAWSRLVMDNHDLVLDGY